MSLPSIRVQVVLEGRPGPAPTAASAPPAAPATTSVGRFLEGIVPAAARVKQAGLVGSVSLALADCGAAALSPRQVAGHWGAACGPDGLDGLTYEHVGGEPSAAHNQLMAGSTDDLTLVAGVDAWASPQLLVELVGALQPSGVGMADAHQLPLEDPKAFDPVSGDTTWASGTCLLARSEVLAKLGGFDAASFPSAGADVDLSWRARLGGWRVVHQPAARVFLGQRLAGDGSMVLGDRARHDRALAYLVMAWKYGRHEVVADGLACLLASSVAAERQAGASFLLRRDGGQLPPVLPGGDSVAELAGGHFGPQRFGYRLAGCPQVAGPGPAAAARTSPPPDAGSVFLSVLVRTQGQRLETLHDALLSLWAQTTASFEVLVLAHDVDQERTARIGQLLAFFPPSFTRRTRLVPVEGGGRSRPLNVGANLARGRYVVALDDDDVALGNWVETFEEVATRAPGRVARSRVALQGVAEAEWADRPGYVTETGLDCPHPARFDLWEHLVDNQTPICAAAVPRTCFSELGLGYDEDLPVLEDWDLLLQAAIRVGVEDADAVTAVYRTWRTGPRSTTSHGQDEWDSARQAVIDKLDAAPLTAPPGSAALVRSLQLARGRHAAEIDALEADRDALRSRRDALEADRDALRSRRDALEADRDALRSQRDALEADRDALRSQRDALRRSTSWRLTAPLRLLRSVLRALLPDDR